MLDQDPHGSGQWKEWNSTWGLPFIWTSLHTFGGAIGLKDNLSLINALPFDAPPPVTPGADPLTQAVGVGYTPEGLDQNPAYYELLQEAAFRDSPVQNITAWLVARAHRRYGLSPDNEPNVAAAWAALGTSGYARDTSVDDNSGVGILPGTDLQNFGQRLCTRRRRRFASSGPLGARSSTPRRPCSQHTRRRPNLSPTISSTPAARFSLNSRRRSPSTSARSRFGLSAAGTAEEKLRRQ